MRRTSLVWAMMLAGCAGPIAAPPSTDGRGARIELGAADASRLAFRPSGAGFRAVHSTHEIQVRDGGAWSFSPTARRPGRAVQTGAALQIETTSVGRGAPAGSRPTLRAREDGALEMDRGFTVEKLINGTHGVEQSWSFANKPEPDPSASGGVADLMVRVAVKGQALEKSLPTELTFRDPQSGLGVRFGAVTWVDAHGERTPIAAKFEDGEIVLTVGHDLVERSAYPAVLDPTWTPAVLVDMMAPGGFSYLQQAAYNRQNGQWLIFWWNFGLFAQRMSYAAPNLTLTGAHVSPGADPNFHVNGGGVTYDGANYQLVWCGDGSGGWNGMQARRLDGNGNWVEGAPITLDAAFTTSNPRLATNAVGLSLLVFEKGGALDGQLMSAGLPVGSSFVIDATATAADVASDGNGFYVAYTYTGGGTPAIYGRTVSPAGVPSPIPTNFASDVNIASASVSFGHGSYLAAWTGQGINQDAYGAFVTNGVAGAPFSIYAPGDSNYTYLISTSFDGSVFQAAFNHQSCGYGPAYVRSISPTGTLGAVSPMIVDAVERTMDVVSDGAGHTLIANQVNVIPMSIYAEVYTSGSDGAGCTNNGDCDHGHCVHNVCCNAACAADTTCAQTTCSNGTTCVTTNVAQCDQSTCELANAGICPVVDTDGDGLSDAWETSNSGPTSVPPNVPFIDHNCNGAWDPGEALLPGASPAVPDIYVYYDWMDWSPPGNACVTTSDCTSLGGAHAGETCTGGQCLFSCPSIGAAGDAVCAARAGTGHAFERCLAVVGGPLACQHTHDPNVVAPGAMNAVAAAYTARGYNLHLIPGSAKPHSLVASYRTDGAITIGCEGAQGVNVGVGKYAVSVYDLKSSSAPAFPAYANRAYHYGLFAHYSSCDTTAHCLGCPYAQNPDGSPKAAPNPGQSGIAEISGNDFIVSLGNRTQDVGKPPGLFNEGTTFMHELGHNLGLRHGGGIDTPCVTNADCPGVACTATPVGNYCLLGEDTNWKPNFLSIMNYRYQFTGVQSAAMIGGSVPTTQRLDYSTLTLPTGGNTPGWLDQSNVAGTPPGDPGLGLSESAGLGGGASNADVITFTDALTDIPPLFGPVQGPVSWSGATFNAAHVEADTSCGVDHPCPVPPEVGLALPRLAGHTDWVNWVNPASTKFTYKFQCTPYFGDGAGPPQGVTGGEVTAGQEQQMHLGDPPIPARVDVRPGCTNNWVNTSSALTASTTINYTGGGCQVCGGTYSCFTDNTQSFTDPTPANSVVSIVAVTLSGVNCSGSNVSIYVDNNLLGVVNPGANCSCNNCQTFNTIQYAAALGIPGWVYGGTNSLRLVAAGGGTTCISRATVTVTYGTVPVVIYGSALLDVVQIDATQLRFGKQLLTADAYSDVDGDGRTDLTAQFKMSALSLPAGSSVQAITGALLNSGQLFTGADWVTVTNNQPACTHCGGWDGGTTPGCWYISNVATSCATTCSRHGGFNAPGATHLGNPLCTAVYPEKPTGWNWMPEECCSTDNNIDFGANNTPPDPNWSYYSCHIPCDCVN